MLSIFFANQIYFLKKINIANKYWNLIYFFQNFEREYSMHFIESVSSLEKFAENSREILQELFRDRKKLRELILEIPSNEKLFSLCEHYDILDKIVLYVSENQKIRVRLHVFGDGYFDRPHNHRWSYTSCILSGGYLHTIFHLHENAQTPSIEHLYPVLIRQEKVGDLYTLHFSQYHSVVAQPGTVTLVVRGLAETQRFRVMDRVTEESWWQYGAAEENEEEKKKKQMSGTQFNEAVAKLMRIGVI